MKNNIVYRVALCLLSFSTAAYAHQPHLSSTLLVEQGDDHWVLQVRAALTAFEYEVEGHFGESAYTTPEEFQKLVLQHVWENIGIRINDSNNLTIKNGVVQLGHETKVTFEVIGVPDRMETIQVSNHSFDKIHRSQSTFMVIRKGFPSTQNTMNESNDHSIKLTVVGNQLVVTEDDQVESSFQVSAALFTILLLLFSLGLGFFAGLRPDCFLTPRLQTRPFSNAQQNPSSQCTSCYDITRSW